MRRRGSLLCTAACVAALLLPACSDDEAATTGSSAPIDAAATTDSVVGSDTTDAPQSSEDEELLDVIPDDVLLDPMEGFLDEDGVLTFDGAMALFSAAFTPMPGVTPAPDGDVHETTSILSRLVANRDAMTPEQQAVLDSVVLAGEDFAIDDFAPPATTGRGLATGAGAAMVARSAARRTPAVVSDETRQRLADAAQRARGFFRSELGRDLPVPIRIAVVPAEVGGVRMFGAETVADATIAGDGGGQHCRIRVNGSKLDGSYLDFVMAHEVFHCFQFSIPEWEDAPSWVVEGTAEWAAEAFDGGENTLAQGWTDQWVLTPTRPIIRRTYDAVGLYALVTELGTPMFRYVDDLLRRPQIATVRAAAGPRLDIEWALSYAGRPSWGPRYTLTEGSFIGRGPQRVPLRATVDAGPISFPSLPPSRESGAQVYSLAADGDVLLISGNGFGGIRFDGADEMEFNGAFAGDFCLKAGGCVCPDGSSTGAGGREITGRGGRSVFIGWGPMGDANPQLEVKSLEQWCNNEAAPDTTGPMQSGCLIGTWVTTRMNIPPVGDQPPLVGGDGMRVEFREDGTFVANYDTMQPAFAWLDQKNNIGMELQFTGVVPGTWAIDEVGGFVGTGDTSALRVVARLTGAMEQEVLNMSVAELAASLGAVPDPVGVYHVASCSGGRMTITTIYGGGELSLELQRAT